MRQQRQPWTNTEPHVEKRYQRAVVPRDGTTRVTRLKANHTFTPSLFAPVSLGALYFLLVVPPQLLFRGEGKPLISNSLFAPVSLSALYSPCGTPKAVVPKRHNGGTKAINVHETIAQAHEMHVL